MKAFRPHRRLNAAVFDSVMVGIAARMRERVVSDLSSVNQAYEKLLDNQEFLAFSLNANQISSSENVRSRVGMAISAFKYVV